jgi:transposase
MDETACALDPPLVRCWMKKGMQQSVPAQAGSKRMLHISGGFNLLTSEVTVTTAQTRISDDFIAFLEELMLKRYPTQAVYLILDNASFHHSAASRAVISLFGARLQTFWLPAHCPELNPIERYWRHLKTKALGNRSCNNLDEVEQAIRKEVANQNTPTSTDRYTAYN